jgi:hypothetical protein
MDERIEIDLNGKLTLPLRLLRAAVVAARTGWSDRLAGGAIPEDRRSLRQAGW